MHKMLLPFLVSVLLSFGGSAFAEDAKLTFWNQQRRGANCFNKAITTNYFSAAHAAGIEFLRLAPDKWKPQQRALHDEPSLVQLLAAAQALGDGHEVGGLDTLTA